MTRLAAVTGGTGFLGSAVVDALLDEGWRVRLLARRNPMHPRFARRATGDAAIEVVFGGLDDAEALRRLVFGADAVVHAAGLVAARSRADFQAVNRDGSGRVAAAVAATAPTARLILVSSFAAREPQLSAYAASKRAGEEAALAACGGAPWAIVRPPAIYGPWDRATLTIFRAAAGPVLPLFHGPDARLCLIHVEDAARAVAALCRAGPAGCVFELSDPRREGHPWRSVLEEAARAVGTTPRIVRVPRPLVRLGGAVAGILGRLPGRPPILSPPILSPGKVLEMLHPDWSSDPRHQPPPDLWSPRVALPDGFAATVRWYRDTRWM